jgi:hypothetical protein
MRSIALILVLGASACNSTLEPFRRTVPDGGTADTGGLVATCPGGIGLTLVHEAAHFGLVPFGETATERVAIINESACVLWIRPDVSVLTPAFAVASSSVADGVFIEAGNMLEVDLQFSPTQAVRYESELFYSTEELAFAKIELAGDGHDPNASDIVCQSREQITTYLGLCIERELECFNGRDTIVAVENIVAAPPPPVLLSVAPIQLPMSVPANSAFFFSVEFCGSDVGRSKTTTTIELFVDEGADTSTVTMELELIVH